MDKKSNLPKFSLAGIKNFLLILVFFLFSFFGGYQFGVKGFIANFENFPQVTITREVPPAKNLDFSLFWKVWDTLEASYFDKSKLNESKMLYGAIKGMVEALGDPYTAFLPPQENRVVREDLGGNFEGVGIQIGFKGSQLAVVAPLPGSPAEKAGIKAGDFIIGIKDERKDLDRGTVGISLPEAVQAIRGKAGTKVTLVILRKDEEKPLVFEITRSQIDVPSVVLTFEKEGKIAHLKLLKFGEETQGEWDKAIKEILDKKVDGIVLDLRNDPGGLLQGAIDTASEFLSEGVIVIQENSKGERDEIRVSKSGRLLEMPVVVLVNKGSASASEILAGALKDNGRARIFGETTFGKGTVQEPVDINGGASLHITVARWLTPSGTWIDEKGIDPDVKIEDNEDTPEDEQLQEAIKALLEK